MENKKEKDLTEWSKEIHQGNVDRGFYDNPKEFGTSLMLVTSELAEAIEADRQDLKADLVYFDMLLERNPFPGSFKETIKDTVEDELADAVIRLLDLCGSMGIDIQRHIELKLEYNATRSIRHGKKY